MRRSLLLPVSLLSLIVGVCLGPVSGRADLRLPHIFGDHMVLQQRKDARLDVCGQRPYVRRKEAVRPGAHD